MIRLNQKKVLSDFEIDQGYDLIRNKFFQIKSIFPPKYRNLKIEYIVLPKVTSIYSLINNNYLNYLTYKKKDNIFLSQSYKLYIKYIFQKTKQKYFQSLKPESNLDLHLNGPKLEGLNHNCNLFFVNMGSYLNVIKKYIDKSKVNNNKIIITKKLYDSNLDLQNYIIFDEFLSDKIIDEYNECKERFKNCFNESQEFLTSLFHIDEINFYKCSYFGFQNVFESLIPEAYLHLRVLDNIFDQLDVNNVITIRNRRIFDRAVNLKSYELNKENYILLHSNIGNTSKFVNEMGHFKYIKNAFVWNKYQSDMIKKSKYNDIQNYYTYGSPLFDSIKINNNHFSKNNKNIFIPGGTIPLNKKLIFSLVNKKFINNKYNIIIKYHPNDNSDKFLTLQNQKNIKLFDKFENINNLIAQSKLVITDLSEASILAMIMNKPVFFISLNDYISSLFKDIFYFNREESDFFCFNNMTNLIDSTDLIMNDNLFYNKVVSIQKKYIKKFISKQNFELDECSNNIDKVLNDI